uniref:RNA-dependent RNA polymerase n=1 Tax=Rhizoctonia solani alphavirus-like 3 TaxID=2600113 RepID=A0A5B8GQ76_9VIRU|nr:RNA-dependent RNA polymerase [Rhizoctonia solani alphavirus-like 3]
MLNCMEGGDMILVPTNQLANAWRTKLRVRRLNVAVHLIDEAIANNLVRPDVPVLWIDEAYRMPLSYVKHVCSIAPLAVTAGDVFQRMYRGPFGVAFQPNFTHCPHTANLSRTHRLTPDVVDFLRRARCMQPGANSALEGEQINVPPVDGRTLHITAHARNLNIAPGAVTIDASQGLEADNVVLHVFPTDADLLSGHGALAVAMTRQRRSLQIIAYGAAPAIVVRNRAIVLPVLEVRPLAPGMVGSYEAYLASATDATAPLDMPALYEVDEVSARAWPALDDEYDQVKEYNPPRYVTTLEASTALYHLAPGINTQPEFAELRDRHFSNVDPSNSLTAEVPDVPLTLEWPLLHDAAYNWTPGQAVESLSAIFSRLLGPAHTAAEEAEPLARHMLDIFTRTFLDPSRWTAAKTTADSVMEWVRSREPRKFNALLRDLEGSGTAHELVAKFFVKSQLKPKFGSYGKGMVMEAGQGINGATQSLNLSSCPLTVEAFRNLQQVSRSDVIWFTGFSNSQLDAKVRACGGDLHDSYTCTDISQQDSHHSAPHRLFGAMLLAMLTGSTEIAEVYLSTREFRSVSSFTANLKFTVIERLFSGEAFTIFLNTTTAAAENAINFCFPPTCFYMGIGDDAVFAGKWTRRPSASRIRVAIKVEHFSTLDFCNRMWTSARRSLPDPCRMIAKHLKRANAPELAPDLYRAVLDQNFTPYESEVDEVLEHFAIKHKLSTANTLTLVDMAVALRDESYFAETLPERLRPALHRPVIRTYHGLDVVSESTTDDCAPHAISVVLGISNNEARSRLYAAMSDCERAEAGRLNAKSSHASPFFASISSVEAVLSQHGSSILGGCGSTRRPWKRGLAVAVSGPHVFVVRSETRARAAFDVPVTQERLGWYAREYNSARAEYMQVGSAFAFGQATRVITDYCQPERVLAIIWGAVYLATLIWQTLYTRVAEWCLLTFTWLPGWAVWAVISIWIANITAVWYSLVSWVVALSEYAICLFEKELPALLQRLGTLFPTALTSTDLWIHAHLDQLIPYLATAARWNLALLSIPSVPFSWPGVMPLLQRAHGGITGRLTATTWGILRSLLSALGLGQGFSVTLPIQVVLAGGLTIALGSRHLGNLTSWFALFAVVMLITSVVADILILWYVYAAYHAVDYLLRHYCHRVIANVSIAHTILGNLQRSSSLTTRAVFAAISGALHYFYSAYVFKVLFYATLVEFALVASGAHRHVTRSAARLYLLAALVALVFIKYESARLVVEQAAVASPNHEVFQRQVPAPLELPYGRAAWRAWQHDNVCFAPDRPAPYSLSLLSTVTLRAAGDEEQAVEDQALGVAPLASPASSEFDTNSGSIVNAPAPSIEPTTYTSLWEVLRNLQDWHDVDQLFNAASTKLGLVSPRVGPFTSPAFELRSDDLIRAVLFNSMRSKRPDEWRRALARVKAIHVKPTPQPTRQRAAPAERDAPAELPTNNSELARRPRYDVVLHALSATRAPTCATLEFCAVKQPMHTRVRVVVANVSGPSACAPDAPLHLLSTPRGSFARVIFGLVVAAALILARSIRDHSEEVGSNAGSDDSGSRGGSVSRSGYTASFFGSFTRWAHLLSQNVSAIPTQHTSPVPAEVPLPPSPAENVERPGSLAARLGSVAAAVITHAVAASVAFALACACLALFTMMFMLFSAAFVLGLLDVSLEFLGIFRDWQMRYLAVVSGALFSVVRLISRQFVRAVVENVEEIVGTSRPTSEYSPASDTLTLSPTPAEREISESAGDVEPPTDDPRSPLAGRVTPPTIRLILAAIVNPDATLIDTDPRSDFVLPVLDLGDTHNTPASQPPDFLIPVTDAIAAAPDNDDDGSSTVVPSAASTPRAVEATATEATAVDAAELVDRLEAVTNDDRSAAHDTEFNLADARDFAVAILGRPEPDVNYFRADSPPPVRQVDNFTLAQREAVINYRPVSPHGANPPGWTDAEEQAFLSWAEDVEDTFYGNDATDEQLLGFFYDHDDAATTRPREAYRRYNADRERERMDREIEHMRRGLDFAANTRRGRRGSFDTPKKRRAFTPSPDFGKPRRILTREEPKQLEPFDAFMLRITPVVHRMGREGHKYVKVLDAAMEIASAEFTSLSEDEVKAAAIRLWMEWYYEIRTEHPSRDPEAHAMVTPEQVQPLAPEPEINYPNAAAELADIANVPLPEPDQEEMDWFDEMDLLYVE